jgi:hypothetical protein
MKLCDVSDGDSLCSSKLVCHRMVASGRCMIFFTDEIVAGAVVTYVFSVTGIVSPN